MQLITTITMMAEGGGGEPPQKQTTTKNKTQSLSVCLASHAATQRQKYMSQNSHHETQIYFTGRHGNLVDRNILQMYKRCGGVDVNYANCNISLKFNLGHL